MAQSLRVGAGGKWRVFDEMPSSSVVKQQSNMSCGPACGEMLFRDRGLFITQQQIEKASYVPIDAKGLAKVLNKLDLSQDRLWAGGTVVLSGASDKQLIQRLNQMGSWAAVMWERSASIGHLVVIDEFDKHGRLIVRDPWDGTSYTMELDEFLSVWMGIALYSLKLGRSP